MAYTINHYNGTLLTTVADGTVDSSTDLTLIGKNYAGYGTAQNDNFIWLLENFANTTQPPHPLAGQIWFDSANLKLKFYDGSQFRTAGGTEVSATPPTGLTIGDLWFDTSTDQLFAYNGDPATPFTLIGPQAVAGEGLTEMQSISVKDIGNQSHAIIQAVINGVVVFVISTDAAFNLNAINPILGFDRIEQGLTLAYTKQADNGVTNSSAAHRWWGTATNSEKLGGHVFGDFLLNTGAVVFKGDVNFPDTGYTVGGSAGTANPKLKVSITNGGLTPTIENVINDIITFHTTSTLAGNPTLYPLTIKGSDVLPGGVSSINYFTSDNVNNLGSSTARWANVYSVNFNGTATNANYLILGGNPVTAQTASVASTIVGRDANKDIFANVFHGTATSANYADLAEKYLADAEYEVGTVVSIGGTAEITASKENDLPIGVISEHPAFRMNQTLVGGVYVALKGRVPVKVIGSIVKGQRLVASNTGYAQASTDKTDTFAIALETNNTLEVKLVECVIL
jgi:hypothetical protein